MKNAAPTARQPLLSLEEATFIAERLHEARKTLVAAEASRAACAPESLKDALVDSLRLLEAAGLSTDAMPPQVASPLLTAAASASPDQRVNLVATFRWLCSQRESATGANA